VGEPHKSVRIIGLDPGLRHTGWGVIDVEGSRLTYVASGAVHPPTDLDLGPRLAFLFEALTDILIAQKPDEAAVEATFVNKDATATLKLGQARGVVMLAPARLGYPVSEYAPNQVKKTVVGVGHADKAQIRHMIKMLLPRATFKTADEADALAIAITHAQWRRAIL
jgi:crossover junction endodeoxyribonuclease RuvC